MLGVGLDNLPTQLALLMAEWSLIVKFKESCVLLCSSSGVRSVSYLLLGSRFWGFHWITATSVKELDH